MPIILFKYIAKRNIACFLLVLAIISLIIFMFDFMEIMRLSRSSYLDISDIFKLAVMKNYSHMQKALPFVFTISTILTYSSLTKTSELIIIRAYGMSVWQFLLPTLFVAFVFSNINLLFLNPIGASLSTQYEKTEVTHLKGNSNMISVSKNGLWLREVSSSGNTIIHAQRISRADKKLYDVTFLVTDENNSFVYRIDANIAMFRSNRWIVKDATQIDRDLMTKFYDEITIPTKIKFNQIQESIVSPETISIYKLPNFIESTESSGLSVLIHQNYFYRLLISPVFYIAMILIGVSFATSPARHNRSFSLISYGVLFSFTLYFISNILNATAINSNTPVIIASLSPALLCLALGLYLTIHYEDG